MDLNLKRHFIASMGASQSALKSVAALKLALFWREAMSEAASENFYLAFDRVFVTIWENYLCLLSNTD